jgi:hypothetical protein
VRLGEGWGEINPGCGATAKKPPPPRLVAAISGRCWQTKTSAFVWIKFLRAVLSGLVLKKLGV